MALPGEKLGMLISDPLGLTRGLAVRPEYESYVPIHSMTCTISLMEPDPLELKQVLRERGFAK